MTNINRRTALLGTVTLPAALAPLGLAQGVEPDPAIAAFEEWKVAYARDVANFDRDELPDDDPEKLAAEEAEMKAARKLAAVVPTTLAGMAAQIAFAHYVFGEPKHGTRTFSVEGFEVHQNFLNDDRESRLLRSLMAGVERLAGKATA